MKKRNIYLIACMVAAVLSINSFAAIIVSDVGSSIDLSVVGGEANGYRSSVDLADTGTVGFTMTGGSVTVANTGDFAARGVYSDNVAGAAVVDISGGTLTVSDGGGTKDVALVRLNDHDDSLLISGGTFNATETGDGGLYAIRMIRDGNVTISGGTFNFSQNDSSVGGIFVGGGAGAPLITLSGGLFNNLDQFDTHVSLSDSAIMDFQVLSLTDTGLTYTGDVVDQATGTIAGVLADGNSFSFVFERLESSNITTTLVPEPAALGLIAVTGVSVLFIRRRLMM